MTLTEAAADRLRRLYASGREGMLLRIGVKTKGCSGMSYDMSWVESAGPADEVVTDKGLTVLVDRKASLFLIGTVMDYESKGLTRASPSPTRTKRAGAAAARVFTSDLLRLFVVAGPDSAICRDREIFAIRYNRGGPVRPARQTLCCPV